MQELLNKLEQEWTKVATADIEELEDKIDEFVYNLFNQHLDVSKPTNITTNTSVKPLKTTPSCSECPTYNNSIKYITIILNERKIN